MPESLRQSFEAAPENGRTKIPSSLMQITRALTLSALAACSSTDSNEDPIIKYIEVCDTDDTDDTDDTEDTGDSNEAIDTAETGDTADTAVEEPECDPTAIPGIGAWPTTDTTSLSHTEGDDLQSTHPGFEPSGIAYLESNDTFYVVGDEGDIVAIHDDLVADYFSLVGNWEDVGVDQSTGLLYLAEETTTSIEEFDPSTGSLTGVNCILNMTTDAPNKLGFEGLTFVGSEAAPSSWASDSMGYFAAASQSVSSIYIFPASTCTGGRTIDSIASVPTSTTDTSGIQFDKDTHSFIVLHDGPNTVDMVDLDGTLLTTYTLPTVGQEEGVWTELTDCEAGTGTLWIADDAGNSVTMYTDFPLR